MAKLTTDMVKKQFEDTHDDLYDYSLMIYKNSKTKVKIICDEHGVFEQSPGHHKSGSHCPKCMGLGLSNDEIINKFYPLHGNRYDYSEVDYKNATTKVKIICKEHGIFEQLANHHSKGEGCPTCGGSAILTETIILSRFEKAHGNKFDYSLLVYKNRDTKVKIICKEHGIFEQHPLNHANGQGCPKCAGLFNYSTEEIIQQFENTHKKLYDYSEVDYKNATTKVKIICKEHGIFEQLPYDHKSGRGCQKCSNLYNPTTEEFTEDLRLVHGDKYDYSLVSYKNRRSEINVICRTHGLFSVDPTAHKNNTPTGQCPKCVKQNKFDKHKLDFNIKHNNLYDYSLSKYVDSKTKIDIICKIHGVFSVSPSNHKMGQGCQQCSLIQQQKKQRLTTQSVIHQFNNIYNGEYDYSLVDYQGHYTPVKIICKEHGIFEQTPQNHKNKSGCPICKKIRSRSTQSDILSKFEDVHGDLYDYSNVEYIDYKTPVKIICKEHGVFEQLPGGHIKGSHCPICAGVRIHTPTTIAGFKKTHGDRYDYSKVNYADKRSKVIIICKEHGEFLQRPSAHKGGQGCPKCPKSSALTTEIVIDALKKVHGNLYDYSKTNYKSQTEKLIIICREHGEFTQLYHAHKGGAGCQKCVGCYRRSSKEIIDILTTLRGDRYDYSKIDFISNKILLDIICKKHGLFKQSFDSHKNGSNCPKCNPMGLKTNDVVISEFEEVHHGLYDYSKVNYIGSKERVTIICHKHGEFDQFYYNHIHGSGCPHCTSIGWNRETYKDRITTLYYVKVTFENCVAYKIGLTLTTITDRYRGDIKRGAKIETIKKWVYMDGAEAYDKEQDILWENLEDKYYGEDLLLGGNTELFNIDVLELEKTTKEHADLLF